jgi:hypothetical protein
MYMYQNPVMDKKTLDWSGVLNTSKINTMVSTKPWNY